jgi:phosphatidylserine decarboxylase
MNTLLIFLFESLAISTLTYLYLHKKTRISLKFLYIDNLVVVLFAFLSLLLISKLVPQDYHWLLFFIVPALVVGFAFSLTMIRFWRTPNRKIVATNNELISPADGNVLYIKKVEIGQVPVSIKKGLEAKLDEITQTDILEMPCWLIGINMTPFDVHKNCSPIEGKIILNKHISGKFLSLKEPKAIIENERNTLVVKNDKMTIGIVQTASKLVRRIDSYVKEGNHIEKGEWFGMIRFGSQVDLIIPISCEVNVEIGEQIYAKSTVIAKMI